MAGSGFLNFTKTVLIPVFIAAVLYLVIFHALLPLYRRHRARYSQYLPLQSTSLSSHLPEALQPSSLRDRLSRYSFASFCPRHGLSATASTVAIAWLAQTASCSTSSLGKQWSALTSKTVIDGEMAWNVRCPIW